MCNTNLTKRISYDMEVINIVLAITVLCGVLLIYRLYYHPLAKFPGRKLAAATILYGLAYERRGMFYREIERMHDKFGRGIHISTTQPLR